MTPTEEALNHLEHEFGQFVLVVRLANGNLGVVASRGGVEFLAQAAKALEQSAARKREHAGSTTNE